MTIQSLNKVMEKYRQLNSDLRSARQKIENLEAIQAEADALEENIERIEQRLVELRVAESGARPMQLVQPATEPEQPSMPKWQIMIPLGVVLGLVVGVGLAVLLEFVDTSVQSPADISARIDLPMLGMVPHSDDIDEDLGDLRCAMLKSKGGLMAESFREIRTNLQFSGPIEQHRSLLVTSASPGDGRTTVATNLACTMSQSGRKVLLVDANFRQPAIGSLFPQAPEGGLSSALVGQGDWHEQVTEVEPNLSVMGAGPLPPNPADLLGSNEMKRIADEMAGEYDQVIFDGAPCLVVTDPVVMSSQVAGVLLVVRAGSNTHGIVTRVRNSLQRVGAHITGAVLNGVRATSGGYLRKNYETFYEYHENPKLPR
jgi:capsular exopolysaccharide synthesis family protein